MGGRTLQILVIKPLTCIMLIYKRFDTCILMYIQCIVVITATFLEFSYVGCFSQNMCPDPNVRIIRLSDKPLKTEGESAQTKRPL